MRWLLPLLFVQALADEPLPAPAPAVPAEPPPPAPAVDGPSADDVLTHAIGLLADGDYDQALRVSIPAMAKYPDLAVSFRAIADVAADQLERQRTGPGDAAATGPSTTAPLPRPMTGLPRPYGYRPPPRSPRHVTSLGFGFEIGAPIGFRLELDLDAKKPGGVDAIGVRAGGNTMFYHDVWPVSDMTAFMDFRVNETWQIEATAGGFVYFGFMYPSAGAALQYDPKGPLFVNAGARLGPYGSWLPDATAGFVW